MRIIVPFAPGGPTDVAARLIAQKLSENLGRNFLVENVAGASSNIGTAQAAKAAPDGYTLLVTVNNLVINPSLFDKVAFDPYKDFDPIALAVGFSSAFAVHPSVPAKTVKELIGSSGPIPGKYSYASPGLGTPSHLLGEQFRVTHKLDVVHVPYGGSGPAITAAISGHTPICFAAMSAAAPQARAGKLKVLAVLSERTSSSMPEVPTIAAAGFPGMEGDGWVGALAPMGTPKEIVALLNKQINEIITLPELKEKFSAARSRRGRRHARGFRQAHARRRREMGEGDQGGQYQGQIVKHRLNQKTTRKRTCRSHGCLARLPPH